ncbi:unnamed protein product [Dovyalis caffra]|uniref:Uncharacterized protein n=1 Tax=Dovyalis caffra TaxID=77055 RepID=A0AAV1RXN6_9ROSI|nr:unnamed protein product [Dovyalis caffra]
MKFGKEFASQMVPEWQEAYMGYDHLKTLLKDIKRTKQKKRPSGDLNRALTLYRTFSGLIQRQKKHSTGSKDIESQAIPENSASAPESYDTFFLLAAKEGGEPVLVFLKKLGDEFDKVDSFYKSKVQEVMDEAEMLSKQMDTLIAFRVKAENLQGLFNKSRSLNHLGSDVAATTSSIAGSSRSISMDVQSNRRQVDDLNDGIDDKHTDTIREEIDEKKLKNSSRWKAAPLEILNQAKLKRICETPRSTIKGFFDMSNQTEPKRYRINYTFIFGFKQGAELGYRDVLMLGFGLAVLSIASVLANLDMEMDPRTKDYEGLTELVPLGLVVLVLIICIFPFNIIYRSSRFFFLTSLLHCICAPLYKVSFQDFFLADQLTSQVQALRSLEFYICYYGWGDYKLRQNTCKTSDVYSTFNFIIAVIPYWSRLLQCVRRLFEEKDMKQGYNGLKYFFTIVAVCTRTAYSLDKGLAWKAIAGIFSAIAAVYGTYWDLVMDWGLLQFKSKNWLLRDKLLIPYRSVYFGAMVLNVLLRFAWLQTVLNFQVSFLHAQSLIAIVASLEIIRRGLWNFFRLENEHLHNVGKYRAFKSVPLPFDYNVDEDKHQLVIASEQNQ